MNELQISEYIFKELQTFGAIKWHKNKNHSFYIKFRDVRLGSIRIANHKGRSKYRYTYEVYKNDPKLKDVISSIIGSIKKKASSIKDFDPKKYIVYDVEKRSYTNIESFETYKNIILKKQNVQSISKNS